MSEITTMSMALKSKEFRYNAIVNERKQNHNQRAKQVDYIADQLVKRYNAPNSRAFFCKCAWQLSESMIWSIVGCSEKPNIKSPIKYFVASCHAHMS